MEKNVLITGGTKGIGKAIASLLAKAGYGLTLTYSSDDEAASRTAAELEQYTSGVHLLKADISRPETIDVIEAYIREKGLTFEAIIFNAGLTCRDTFEAMRLADWERVFFANVHFPVFLLQRVINSVNKGGSIVFTGSEMGVFPHSVSLVYGVTKSAIHALVKNLVKFLQPYGVRVNAVAPGFVDTEWQKEKPGEIRRSIEGKIALGRFCEPDEVAGVYQMLIENKYFNGEVVVIDGAYSYK